MSADIATRIGVDVVDGYVSQEQAAERYGVDVTEDGELDREATEDLRAQAESEV